MLKKRLILLVVLPMLMLLTSCGGLDDRRSLDENKHNQIEVVFGDKDISYLIYQNQTYNFAGETGKFHVDTYEEDDYYLPYQDDIMLSWNGYRYIWYIDTYYSYTSDNPLFIYNSRLGSVYFRQDYDYSTDTFMIKSTDASIIFNDIFDSCKRDVEFVPQIMVEVCSVQCARIRITLEMAFIGNRWYISMPNSKEVFTASDEFLEILSYNGFI